MASYSIRWKQSAQKELKRLDQRIIPRIIAALEALIDEPQPSGSKKLQGAEYLWRIRIGNCRVIYSVDSAGC